MKVSLPALTELPVLAPRKRRQDRRTPKSAASGEFRPGRGSALRA